jgi:hypothetical protein
MGAAETAIREARATFGKAAIVARKGEVVNLLPVIGGAFDPEQRG